MRRAQLSGVRCVTDGDLGRGDFLRDERDEYDAVVFCEILEHVTFNPVRFWRRVYDLLRPGGCVYLTTPNSLRLTNVLKTLARLLVRRGVGIPVNEILGYVTYGHHWKEYSAAELREYFAILSPDFVTEIRYADFFVGERSVGRLVARAAGVVPGLRPHIEAVVRLPTKTEWRAEEKTSYAE
jgi:SAM-dependent methyltransferase